MRDPSPSLRPCRYLLDFAHRRLYPGCEILACPDRRSSFSRRKHERAIDLDAFRKLVTSEQNPGQSPDSSAAESTRTDTAATDPWAPSRSVTQMTMKLARDHRQLCFLGFDAYVQQRRCDELAPCWTMFWRK